MKTMFHAAGDQMFYFSIDGLDRKFLVVVYWMSATHAALWNLEVDKDGWWWFTSDDPFFHFPLPAAPPELAPSGGSSADRRKLELLAVAAVAETEAVNKINRCEALFEYEDELWARQAIDEIDWPTALTRGPVWVAEDAAADLVAGRGPVEGS